MTLLQLHQVEIHLTASTYGGVSGASDDTSIVTGLLPNVWGMTLKAPTANGLDISARLGLIHT